MVPILSPIEKRIEKEKAAARLRTKEEFLALIEKEALGPKSRELLKQMLEYEGWASDAFLLFDVPPVIDRAKGATIWDVDGNEFIDLVSGFAVMNVGYTHRKIVEAIKEQCERMIHSADFPHELRIKLAKELLDIAPGPSKKKVHFTVSGAEAIETSLKLARYYTGRPNIIATYGCYHGRTYGAMNVTCRALLRYYQGFSPAVGVTHVPYAYCYRCLFDKEYPDCDLFCTKYIEELLHSDRYGLRWPEGNINTVASIIVEPMLGASGYIVPPREFLRTLREIADNYELLLTVDEVQTGWGRTGNWWGCQDSGIEPDIMPTAKSIAGGLPLSVTISKAEIQDNMGPGTHLSTFAHSPLACAAALATIRVFKEEKLVERSKEIGDYFLKALKEIQDVHKLLGNVDGKGLFIGMELVKNQKTKEPATEEARTLKNRCLKRGLLLSVEGMYGNIIKVIPPLVIEKEQIDKAVEILDEELKVLEGQRA